MTPTTGCSCPGELFDVGFEFLGLRGCNGRTCRFQCAQVVIGGGIAAGSRIDCAFECCLCDGSGDVRDVGWCVARGCGDQRCDADGLFLLSNVVLPESVSRLIIGRPNGKYVIEAAVSQESWVEVAHRVGGADQQAAGPRAEPNKALEEFVDDRGGGDLSGLAAGGDLFDLVDECNDIVQFMKLTECLAEACG